MKRSLLLAFALLVMLAGSAWAQDRVISGKVIGKSDNQPMPGVNVLVKGTSIGAVTNLDGEYKLSVPAGATTLVFSFTGMKTTEVAIGASSSIDLSMEEDAKVLDEIVVTGYQQLDVKTYAGSSTVVKGSAIAAVPIASFDQTLQGRAAGVLIQAPSGQPGAAAQVLIRGRGSFADNNPTYIVDGVEISANQFATMNPNDFERFDILKDAVATSMYGSRGANGVIVITTKKGKAGKTQFDYMYQQGWSQAPQHRLDLMNGNEKIDFELRTGGTLLSTYSAAQIAALRQVNTDWTNELLQTARTRTHELSARGGNEKTKFYVSGNYFSQDGTVRLTNLKRYTGRINLEHRDGNFLLGHNMSLGYSTTNNTREGDEFVGSPLNAIRWMNPYLRPRDEFGNYTVNPTGQPNPLQELELNKSTFSDVKIISATYLQYDIPQVKGLNVRTNWGVDYQQRENTGYLDRNTASGGQATGNQGSFSRSYSRNTRFTGTTSINYNRKFQDHSINASLVHELIYNDNRGFGFTGFGLVGNLRNEAGITQGTATNNFIPTVNGSQVQSALSSFFGLVNYAYKGKYSFSGSLRRDASSRFGANFRNGIFYAAGASWVFGEEAFMQSVKNIVSFGKISANYGVMGNQRIGDFVFLPVFSPSGSYNGQQGLTQTQIANPDIRWEPQSSLNLALELGFLKDRIHILTEYYERNSTGSFLPQPLSRTTGFASITQNIAHIRNSGIEFTLTTTNIQGKEPSSFRWTTSFNVTWNRNQIVKLADGDRDIIGATIQRVGNPMFSQFVVPFQGVNPANGDALYLDINGNITNQYNFARDARVFGPRDAPYFGGFENTFSYKGVTLSAQFTWQQGNQILNADRSNVINPDYVADQMSREVLRAWTTPGQVTDVPRMQTASGLTANPYFSNTSRLVEDGSFLRFRNLIVSYNLPASILERAKLRDVRVFAQAQNLYTWTSFTGWDPELAASTNTGAQYPAMRTFTLGLNVGL